jgi:hypothetical protein
MDNGYLAIDNFSANQLKNINYDAIINYQFSIIN